MNAADRFTYQSKALQDRFVFGRERPAYCGIVAFDVLGRREHADVSPKLKHWLKRRRQKCIIDRKQHARFAGHARNRSNVRELKRRVCRRLNEDQFGARLNCLRDGTDVRCIHKACAYAHALKHLAKQANGPAINYLRDDGVVVLFQDRQEQRRNRGHSG